MMQIFELGRWSITFGGSSYPVWHVRRRMRGPNDVPTPIGRAYPSLFSLVCEQESEKPDAVLWAVLERCKEFMHSPDYRALTEPIRKRKAA